MTCTKTISDGISARQRAGLATKACLRSLCKPIVSRSWPCTCSPTTPPLFASWSTSQRFAFGFPYSQ